MVEMRGNSAAHATVALSEEELRLGMAEPRVLARRNEAVNVLLQRRHPIGIARVQAECEFDKRLANRSSIDETDGAVRVPYVCLTLVSDRNSVVKGMRV